MGRRPQNRAPSARRRRRGLGFELAAVDVAWDSPPSHRDWVDEIDPEPESLADLLASECGIDPLELEDVGLFESFMDAMEAELWQDPGRRRTVN